MLRYLVGKHSPGTMNVVAFGPVKRCQRESVWESFDSHWVDLPKLKKKRQNTKIVTREASVMCSKQLPSIKSNTVSIANPPIWIGLRPITSTRSPVMPMAGEGPVIHCSSVVSVMMSNSYPYMRLRPTTSANEPKKSWPRSVPADVTTFIDVSLLCGILLPLLGSSKSLSCR